MAPMEDGFYVGDLLITMSKAVEFMGSADGLGQGRELLVIVSSPGTSQGIVLCSFVRVSSVGSVRIRGSGAEMLLTSKCYL